MRGALIILFAGACRLASAHDLSASHATVRLKANTVEVEIKIAADSIWPLVQETVAPGAIFVLEDFATVGRPLLVSFAKTMEELTENNSIVAPRSIDVAVVEDNFIFTFVYARTSAATIGLKENYLRRMPADYVFLAMVEDEQKAPLMSQVLHSSLPSMELIPSARTPKPSTFFRSLVPAEARSS